MPNPFLKKYAVPLLYMISRSNGRLILLSIGPCIIYGSPSFIWIYHLGKMGQSHDTWRNHSYVNHKKLSRPLFLLLVLEGSESKKKLQNPADTRFGLYLLMLQSKVQMNMSTCTFSTSARSAASPTSYGQQINTRPARHRVVTTFVEVHDADDGGEREDINCIINAELHRCIREARDILDKSYNSEVHFVSD